MVGASRSKRPRRYLALILMLFDDRRALQFGNAVPRGLSRACKAR
jgi:hypothetical protein